MNRQIFKKSLTAIAAGSQVGLLSDGNVAFAASSPTDDNSKPIKPRAIIRNWEKWKNMVTRITIFNLKC